MITYVKFPKAGKTGYINEKIIVSEFKEGYTQKDWDDAFNRRGEYESKRLWKSDIDKLMKHNVDKGFKNPTMRACCLNKTFEFATDKINIIFGPNASGKTTILNSIARVALVGDGNSNLDGWTNPFAYRPIDYDFNSRDNMNVEKLIKSKLGTPVEVGWDGNPVYYFNFNNRANYGSFEDMAGSMFGDGIDGLAFNIHQQSMSGAQKSLYKFSKMMSVVQNIPDIDDVCKRVREVCSGYNDVWQNAAEAGIKYIKERYKEKTIATLLIDEIDNSLDILVTIRMFTDILPKLFKENNIQIIVVSHNPLVLSSLLDKNIYNIISMSNKYTDTCKEQLNDINFK